MDPESAHLHRKKLKQKGIVIEVSLKRYVREDGYLFSYVQSMLKYFLILLRKDTTKISKFKQKGLKRFDSLSIMSNFVSYLYGIYAH